MLLKYSPYPVNSNVPKNKWFLGVSWMSGDADHYEKVHYKFGSEEEFLKAAAAFTEAMQYSPGEHTRKIQDILYTACKIDVEWDITNDQFCCEPSFDEHHYFDAAGVKKLVEIV